MSFSWNYDAQPELNEPSLNSPIPCRWGVNCYYTDCCRFVHPGEEGTARKFFPARSYVDNGIQVWEPATVRLIGHARFYERRRLRLSWPAWSQRMGLTAAAVEPVAAPAAEPVPVQDMNQMLMEAYEAERQRIGEALLPIVSQELAACGEESLKLAELWCPEITAQNIIRNILDRHPIVYSQTLITDLDALTGQIIVACQQIYDEQAQAQAQQPQQPQQQPEQPEQPLLSAHLDCAWGDVC